MTAGPRLAPIAREQWGDAERAALVLGFPEAADRFLSTGSDAIAVPNVLTTLMRHPALAGPFLAFNRVLLQEPALDPRLRELIILRVAHRTGSTYEWAQHKRLATSIGLSRDEIDAIARGGARGSAGADRRGGGGRSAHDGARGSAGADRRGGGGRSAHDDAGHTWQPLEADLLAATDQLVDRYRIDDDTWGRLALHLDDKQLVEVVFVAGTYTCLAMAFNSFGLELDPDLQQE